MRAQAPRPRRSDFSFKRSQQEGQLEGQDGARNPRAAAISCAPLPDLPPPPSLPTTSTCPAAAAAPEAARASCSLLVGAATRTGSFPGLPHGRPARPGGPSRSCLPPSLPHTVARGAPHRCPSPHRLRRPAPPLPLLSFAPGVSGYLGHRRRWSAPRWPSRCPTGSRRTSAGDPWRCGGGTGGRDGARSLREPLGRGALPCYPGCTLRWIKCLASAEKEPEKSPRCRRVLADKCISIEKK